MGGGIVGDDTDGHIDELARFVGPSRVVAALESDPADDNYEPLQDNFRRLSAMSDAEGRPFEVIPIAMPRPKFFDKAVPAAWNAFFERLTDAGFALFCAGAAWLCLRMLNESVKLEETDPVLQWQIWPLQTILVAAFGIAVLRHGIYTLWPALRPLPSAGENAPPTDEQVNQFVSEAMAASPLNRAPATSAPAAPAAPSAPAAPPAPEDPRTRGPRP